MKLNTIPTVTALFIIGFVIGGGIADLGRTDTYTVDLWFVINAGLIMLGFFILGIFAGDTTDPRKE
jgi:hypothetical protein